MVWIIVIAACLVYGFTYDFVRARALRSKGKW